MKPATLYRWIALIGAVGVGCWFVPLVHVRPLGAAERGQPATAAELATRFWDGPLALSHKDAHDAAEVLGLLAHDSAKAREAYGRTVGVSRSFLLYLRGEGTVRSIERNGVAVDVIGDDAADLLLLTGPIFGGAVRDATGQLTADQAASSQQFNDIASQLNLLVEERVASGLRELTEGQAIRFVACAELKTPHRPTLPLAAVPVHAEAY